MSVRGYSNDEIGFQVENADEVYEVLDALHTQVIDNLEGNPLQVKLLAALEAAMEQVDEVRG